MKAKEELYQPQFPALHMCVVIDARHSSRSEIMRDVKASALFENIQEAKSVAEGVKRVANTDLKLFSKEVIDACILGPSVSIDTGITFFKDAVAASVSKDCAFIAVLPANNPRKDELLAAGAHRVIETPCSKKVFFEGIVRAVIAANENSPWVSIVLRAEAENADLFGDDAGNVAKQAVRKPDLSNILQRVAPEMKRLAGEVERGNLVPDQNGKPSTQAKQAVTALMQSIFPEPDQNPRTTAFAAFLEEAILKWMLDLRSLTAREASNILHRSLLSYKE